MAEIISINKINSLCRNLKKQGKVIVLAGGCFDVLHLGHVIFLEKAKRAGKVLVVLLESDKKITFLKGMNRPIHSQSERVKALSLLLPVDYIVLLPFLKEDSDYDELVTKIMPDIIAVTAKSDNMRHYKRVAQLVGAKIKLVTKLISNYSTSSLINSVTVQ